MSNQDPPPPVGQVTYATVGYRKPPPPPPPSYSPRDPHHQQQRHKQKQPQATTTANNNDDDDDDDDTVVYNKDDDGLPLVESNLKPDVAGVYAPLLRQQYQRHLENSAVIPLPPHSIGGIRDQGERHKTCHCQRSFCLKLYCECFASGIHCNAYCNCTSCHNDGALQSQYHRNKAILACLEHNPNSFRPGGRISEVSVAVANNNNKETTTTTITTTEEEQPQPPMVRTSKAAGRLDAPCNCTKSRCLKKYCICFNRGLYCKTYCGCSQCYNVRGNKEREILAKVVQQQSGALRVATNTTADVDTNTTTQKNNNNNTSTTIGSASTAAPNKIVDDGTLPPSYYALPMKLPGGVDSASLSFGWASATGTSSSSRNKKRKPADQDMTIAIERAMATEEAVLATRRNHNNHNHHHHHDDHGTIILPRKSPTNPRPRTRVAIQSELEHKWAVETQDVLGTFQAMRQELLERKRDAGLLGADIEIAREYSYYDLVGSAQLAAVELDLADIMTTVKDAEGKARNLAQQEERGQTTNDADDEQALLCDETMDGISNVPSLGVSGPTTRMNSNQREDVIVQAAQDAALMRELARVIRRHALEMKEARLAEQQLD
jgi:Tesmin/TSO1-like CXC domain, cysteine-rich domain